MKDSIRSNKLSSGRFFLEASGFKVAVGKSNLLTKRSPSACCTLVEFRGAYETVRVKNVSLPFGYKHYPAIAMQARNFCDSASE
jgi:hypothetical protein